MVLSGGARWRRVNKRLSPSPHPGVGSNPARSYTRNSGNNTSGPGDPSIAVAVLGDRRTGGRAALVTAGGSRKTLMGGKLLVVH